MRVNAARYRAGWVLAEILCCAIIVSTITICITTSTSMMTKVSKSIHDRRIGAVDLWSLVGEASRRELSGDMQIGAWKAQIAYLTHRAGMNFHDIYVIAETNLTRPPIQWKSWAIEGRSR